MAPTRRANAGAAATTAATGAAVGSGSGGGTVSKRSSVGGLSRVKGAGASFPTPKSSPSKPHVAHVGGVVMKPYRETAYTAYGTDHPVGAYQGWGVAIMNIVGKVGAGGYVLFVLYFKLIRRTNVFSLVFEN